MCTAATYKTADHYFGRTLDNAFSYHETVTITPRHYFFHFRHMGDMPSHYAMIGMAFVQQDYPLYYDATNEKGLSMAGLSFPGNADYKPLDPEKDNLAPFEFIPWILGQCATVAQARVLLSRMILINEDFMPQLPSTPLHWMISDQEESIVVEQVKDGLNIYDNPVGVLSNSPSFDFHMLNLVRYRGLSPRQPDNRISAEVELTPYDIGLGTMGLPGDLYSPSRFVRVAFTKLNSVSGESESESISQFFHILGSVTQQRGCSIHENGMEITVYTSCVNMDKGIYYYTTYENSQITAVDMHHEDLDGDTLTSYPLITGQQIRMQN